MRVDSASRKLLARGEEGLVVFLLVLPLSRCGQGRAGESPMLFAFRSMGVARKKGDRDQEDMDLRLRERCHT